MKPAATALALTWLLCLAVATPARAQGVVGQYHGDPARSGAVVVPGLTAASAATMRRDAAFDGVIAGQIRAQMLYWPRPGAAHGVVLVSTNLNEVAAMDAASGRTVWKILLGPITKPNAAKCSTGITTGILGTPVLDAASGTLYVDTFMVYNGEPQHMVFALNLEDGSVRPGWPVNVAAGSAALGVPFDASVQGQRSALTLVDGKLYVPFASNSGECKTFRGYVVGIDVAGAQMFGVWRTRGEKGGIWGQAGVVSDGTSLYVTTGNTSGTNTWADGEAVIRLRPDLQHSNDTHDWFAPTNWFQLDTIDADLGGNAPLPLDVPRAGAGPARWLLQLGKDGAAYLLDRANLGGLGGALVRAQVATPEVATAPVAYPAAGGTFVAFTGHGANCSIPAENVLLTVLKISAVPGPKIETAWCASLAAQGAPIVTTTDGTSEPIVWIVGAIGDGRLHGFAGATGVPVFAGGKTSDHMVGVRRFETILVAEGRMYVGGLNRVYSFTFTPNL